MKTPGDPDSIHKRVKRLLSRAPADVRGALATLAHLRVSVDGDFMATMGISRKQRLGMLAAGLLDIVGTETQKRYRVPGLVRSQLSWRELHDFTVAEELAEACKARAKKVALSVTPK